MFAKKGQQKIRLTETVPVSEMVSHSRIAGIVCATFSANNNKRVLDFGTINQDIIGFFSNFSCQYDVIDLYSQLLENDIIQDKPILENDEQAQIIKQRFVQIESQIKDTISNCGMRKYDAIFLWDLLNYLTGWQVKLIFKLLTPLCHLRTNILAVFPISKQINQKPLLCSILDYDLIRYELRSDSMGMIKNPGHEKFGFTYLSSGFELSHSSLSKHGLKECLFAVKR